MKKIFLLILGLYCYSFVPSQEIVNLWEKAPPTDNKWHLEKGVFRVQVGGKTADIECVENQTCNSMK